MDEISITYGKTIYIHRYIFKKIGISVKYLIRRIGKLALL
jgi:hypothetical protein